VEFDSFLGLKRKTGVWLQGAGMVLSGRAEEGEIAGKGRGAMARMDAKIVSAIKRRRSRKSIKKIKNTRVVNGIVV
jgi:hypothetical protein